MNNLVTFFLMNDKGDIGVVGVGLTDQMIEHVKKSGAVLQQHPVEKTGVEGTPDLLLVHGETLNDLMAKIKKLTDKDGKMKTTVNII